jgi:nucleoside-diphosphate-sugar epimerase
LKILILGLGWLGKDLALKLKQSNFEVTGTKRNIDDSLIGVHQISWNTEDNLPDNLQADICIISLTPSAILDLNKFEQDLQNLKNVGVKRIIYTSSTGVYDGLENIVNEKTELRITSERQQKLIALEKLVLKQSNSVVLRLAGLVSDDRIPAKFLAAKKNVSGAHQAINMIHKIDVINIIELLITSNYVGIMNAVSSSHQSREEYYSKLCEKFNLEPPEFNSTIEPTRIVSNELSKKILNYEYVVDDTLKYFLS